MLNNADDEFFEDGMTWGRMIDRLEPQTCQYAERPDHPGHGHMSPSKDWPNPKKKPASTVSPFSSKRYLRYECTDCQYEVQFTVLPTGRVDDQTVLRDPY